MRKQFPEAEYTSALCIMRRQASAQEQSSRLLLPFHPSIEFLDLAGCFGQNGFMPFRHILFLLTVTLGTAVAADSSSPKSLTMAQVLTNSKPGDWRPLDPENTLYMDLANGRIVIELA